VRRCSECQRTNTTQWRRGPNGFMYAYLTLTISLSLSLRLVVLSQSRSHVSSR
jgi:hypothetical protein